MNIYAFQQIRVALKNGRWSIQCVLLIKDQQRKIEPAKHPINKINSVIHYYLQREKIPPSACHQSCLVNYHFEID